MIKARECRIGNRLIYGGQPLIVQPEDFHGIQWGLVEGIPLTPEVFKKCILAEHFPIVQCWGESKGVKLRADTYHMRIDEEHIRCIYYLHDLQNIHFALMEKELEVRL